MAMEKKMTNQITGNKTFETINEAREYGSMIADKITARLEIDDKGEWKFTGVAPKLIDNKIKFSPIWRY